MAEFQITERGRPKSDSSEGSKTIRIDHDIDRQFQEMADSLGLKKTEFVRQFLPIALSTVKEFSVDNEKLGFGVKIPKPISEMSESDFEGLRQVASKYTSGKKREPRVSKEDSAQSSKKEPGKAEQAGRYVEEDDDDISF